MMRGFKITENEAYHGGLIKHYRIGYKKNVICLMELSRDYIIIKFGNVKNLWGKMPTNFWDDPKDKRYTEITYLEKVAYKYEIYKLVEFCKKSKGTKVDIDESEMNPESFILNTLKVNPHIHGVVNCLDDINKSIKPGGYDYEYNSKDKNKKHITCGDVKYYYDSSTKRLFCGTVWHHINSMWWVISGNTWRNISASELFDYSPQLPKKKQITKPEVDRLLQKFEANKDYIACQKIKVFYEKFYPMTALAKEG